MGSASEFGRDVGLIHEAIDTGRKAGLGHDFWSRIAHDESFARDLYGLHIGRLSLSRIPFLNLKGGGCFSTDSGTGYGRYFELQRDVDGGYITEVLADMGEGFRFPTHFTREKNARYLVKIQPSGGQGRLSDEHLNLFFTVADRDSSCLNVFWNNTVGEWISHLRNIQKGDLFKKGDRFFSAK